MINRAKWMNELIISTRPKNSKKMGGPCFSTSYWNGKGKGGYLGFWGGGSLECWERHIFLWKQLLLRKCEFDATTYSLCLSNVSITFSTCLLASLGFSWWVDNCPFLSWIYLPTLSMSSSLGFPHSSLIFNLRLFHLKYL